MLEPAESAAVAAPMSAEQRRCLAVVLVMQHLMAQDDEDWDEDDIVAKVAASLAHAEASSQDDLLLGSGLAGLLDGRRELTGRVCVFYEFVSFLGFRFHAVCESFWY